VGLDEELGEKLERLKEVRETAERELETLLDRRERVEQLERDKDELLNSYAKIAPEALDSLSSEERHRLYTMLRMKVTANPDRSLEVSGALGAQFGQSEMLPR
jgi:flagellar motility protein MotE (MotC chaperone)